MKRFFICIGAVLAVLLLITGCSQAIADPTQARSTPESSTAPVAPTSITINGDVYRLTFSDEFNTLDESKWSYCPNMERADIGNSWDASQVRVENGKLYVSTALSEFGYPITGGIRTIDKFSQCQGYFEVSCKIQEREGVWDAFWLMTMDELNVGNMAVDGAEIDVFESFDIFEKRINHAIHWDGYGADHGMVADSFRHPECYDGKFHTYSVLWTDDAYIFYIDGKVSQSVTKDNPYYPGCSTRPTYLKLTVEAGSWAGEFHPEEFPEDSMIVDYVRVYQKA